MSDQYGFVRTEEEQFHKTTDWLGDQVLSDGGDSEGYEHRRVEATSQGVLESSLGRRHGSTTR